MTGNEGVMNNDIRHQTGNALLDGLPEAELSRLLERAQRLDLRQKEDVKHLEGPSHVLFPTTSVLASGLVSQDGVQIGIDIIGREGLVGVPTLLGLDEDPTTLTTVVAGECWRVGAAECQAAMAPGTRFADVTRAFLAYSWRNANQTSLCNLLHTVEQRMCRWLLMIHEQAGADDFPLTHDSLAQMLGVHRQTVTVAAGELQSQQILSSRRGRMGILDRRRLEERSCECYRVIRHFFDHVVRGQDATAPPAFENAPTLMVGV
jgi:CRP-like cAMP-binding protein